jgi:serine/threonine-protein kinase TTK/MPS1
MQQLQAPVRYQQSQLPVPFGSQQNLHPQQHHQTSLSQMDNYRSIAQHAQHEQSQLRTPLEANHLRHQHEEQQHEHKQQQSHFLRQHQQISRRPEQHTPSHTPTHHEQRVFRMPSADKTIGVNGKPYLVLEVAGKGGSSRVYKVLSEDMQIYALKRVKVPASASRSTFDSYANEIQLLQTLKGHPTIVQIHDAEVRRSANYIHLLMEYGDIDLAKLLSRRKGSEVGHDYRRIYWRQMLDAVHTIHENKIVHGDLKPANFLHVKGTLKLIDFGIAKAIQTDDTTKIFRDSQIGTPNYMSPEALIAEVDYDDPNEDDGDLMDNRSSARGMPRPRRYRVGRASDIWSLGCILYQMYYDRTPFAHIRNTIHKMNCIQDPSYPISYPADAHATHNLLDVLRGCLQRDPDGRMSMATLKNHPYLSQDESSSRRLTAPSNRDSVHATLKVLQTRGDIGQYDAREIEEIEREVQNDLYCVKGGGDRGKENGRIAVAASGGSRGGGGHSMSRMTPTVSAMSGHGHSPRH